MTMYCGRRLGPCLRLPDESLFPLGVGRNMFWQDLDRHTAIQPRIARLVNFAHPTALIASWISYCPSELPAVSAIVVRLYLKKDRLTWPERV